jgi:phenylalanine-4-hydroxylase
MENKKYVSKMPDKRGFVDFSPEEHAVWQTLYERQIKLLEGRACDEFIEGAARLRLNPQEIPQLADVSRELRRITQWQVAPVDALISFKEFFQLLASRTFPVATFIRLREDLDYLKEPDIFHEIFGHCPLLTEPAFADFTHRVGVIGTTMSKEERVLLARLYWFTVEFGLIKTREGLRIYGGGILSSIGESVYALESSIPIRQQFDLVTVLRTPYRYDEMQKKYFIIDSFEQLYSLVNADLKDIFNEAKKQGVIEEDMPDVRSC